MTAQIMQSQSIRRRNEPMNKLMFSLRPQYFRTITLEAKMRGITIQELLRAVIIPDWVNSRDIESREPNIVKQTIPGPGFQRRNWSD